MIDIHCHLLPGMDDGPDTLEESLQMAEMAIVDGITHIIATPHANDTYPFHPEVIRERRDELQALVGDRLVLATGCDFHLSYENIQDLRKDPVKYTLNQKNYLLIEFADFSIPATIDTTLHELHLAGLRLIVTHPERNAIIRANPARLAGWVRQGCRVQVTALSLLGRFGRSAQESALWLLDHDAVHFIASDAHNTSARGRPLLLRDAFQFVAERRGVPMARALFHENPLAAFEGRPLPYSPDPPDFDAPAPTKRKRFWFF